MVQEANNGKQVPGVLIATKEDLHKIRKVHKEDGEGMAQSLNLQFFETSAAKANYKPPFEYLAKLMMS